MSLILKGIDLPKGGSIRLIITSCGDVVEVWRDGLAKEYHPNKVIQIPKNHGRIGDLDALDQKCSAPNWCVWLSEIEDAPALLEKEDEQDG